MRVILKATNIPHNPISHGLMPGLFCSSPSGSGESGGMCRLTYGGAIGYIYMSLSGSGNHH